MSFWFDGKWDGLFHISSAVEKEFSHFDDGDERYVMKDTHDQGLGRVTYDEESSFEVHGAEEWDEEDGGEKNGDGDGQMVVQWNELLPISEGNACRVRIQTFLLELITNLPHALKKIQDEKFIEKNYHSVTKKILSGRNLSWI